MLVGDVVLGVLDDVDDVVVVRGVVEVDESSEVEVSVEVSVELGVPVEVSSEPASGNSVSGPIFRGYHSPEDDEVVSMFLGH